MWSFTTESQFRRQRALCVSRRAGEQKYTQASYNEIVVCGIDWHSLDVIWIVLYATLWLGSR